MSKVYVIQSTKIDRSVWAPEIDALCDEIGDPMCWLDKLIAEEYLSSKIIKPENFMVVEVDLFSFLKKLVRMNITSTGGNRLKLAIMG